MATAFVGVPLFDWGNGSKGVAHWGGIGGAVGDFGLGASVFLSPPLNTNESTQAQVGHDFPIAVSPNLRPTLLHYTHTQTHAHIRTNSPFVRA